MTLIAVLVAATLTGHASAAQLTVRQEVLEIDGRKNPEMIPQWSAWEDALRTLAGQADGILPDMIAAHVTAKETATIIREAKQHIGREATCKARLLEATDARNTDTPDVREQKRRAITLECRWATLQARDRILEASSPDARLALLAFVDDVKASTRVTLLKRDLPFFLQPQ